MNAAPITESHDLLLKNVHLTYGEYEDRISTSITSEPNIKEQTESELAHHTMIASNLPQTCVDFDEIDTANPRKWTIKKKSAISCFVLFSAFVA